MDIKLLSEEWIKAEEMDDHSSKYNHWSVDYVIELHTDGKLDELWSFILYTYKQGISNKVIEVLAAGPLEDLLASGGEKYIDEIEDLARKDPKFRNLLGGVWKNAMTDDVWQRVQNAWDRTGWDGN